ncbi:MAG: EAL domain-containing protein [Pseudomonadales bacterium]|nr:EAL domain-containing protein [Pseudomonadales bacterium]
MPLHKLIDIVVGVLFTLLFSLSSNIHASANIVFDENHEYIESADDFFYFEDQHGALSLQDALHLNDKDWSHLPGNIANFGFSESVYWFSFDLKNDGKKAIELYVNVGYPLLDKIDFYAMSDEQVFEQYNSGDLHPFDARPVDYPSFLFPLSLSKNQSKTVLLRIESKGPIQVPLSIWKKETFLLKAQSYLFLYGCFLAIILIMSAYNFCLYIIVRDTSYLYYTFFTLCMAGIHGSLDGFAYQWFWPNAPVWHQISAVTLISLGCISTVLFTNTLLPIPKNSPLNTAIKALLVMTVLSAIITLFIPYRQAAMLNAGITLITMSSVLFICLAMLKHSPRIAKFYSLAWGAYFLGILLKSANKMGYIPYSPVSEYAGNIGGIVGIIILSLALADRINSERRAKEKAQHDAIGSLRRFQLLYENALEGIFSFDLKGNLLSANPAFIKLIGDIKNNDGYTLKPKEFKGLLKEVRKTGQVVDFETTLHNRQEDSIWVNISARLIDDTENDIPQLEGTLINISERKAFEQQMLYLAEHDPLTGFFNRRAFESTAEEKLEKVKNLSEPCCLMYMDLDQFKIVNDLCGHTAGDLLLKNLSKQLLNKTHKIGGGHTIARLGGDEFGILLSNMRVEKARLIAELFRKTVEDFLFIWQGKRYTLGVSIGLVELCPFHHSIEHVLIMADTACYQAKDQGRNRVHTFVESDKELELRQLEMQWVSSIKEAITNNQFFLVFQNIASNKDSNNSYHYEILLRLINSNGNLCAPNQFLPAAERYNLMPNIDRWVIQTYFAWLNENQSHLKHLGCSSINLSTQSLGDDTFSEFLVRIFDEYQIPHNKICFEITEGMAITHIDNTQSFISKFRNLGCRFALDDFGTGFSSYAYLKDLCVDYIKIDGVFIKNLANNTIDNAMVKSICDVAKAMGIETIAEFVEDEAILQRLKEIGIDFSQGYHIHKPTTLDRQAFKVIEENH